MGGQTNVIFFCLYCSFLGGARYQDGKNSLSR